MCRCWSTSEVGGLVLVTPNREIAFAFAFAPLARTHARTHARSDLCLPCRGSTGILNLPSPSCAVPCPSRLFLSPSRRVASRVVSLLSPVVLCCSLLFFVVLRCPLCLSQLVSSPVWNVIVGSWCQQLCPRVECDCRCLVPTSLQSPSLPWQIDPVWHVIVGSWCQQVCPRSLYWLDL